MKTKKLSATFFLILLASGAAHAVDIDFKALAEPGGGIGETAYELFDLTPYGLTGLEVTAARDGGATDAFVYFDARNAGIGVCGAVIDPSLVGIPSNGGANNCDPGSDDGINFANGELIAFTNNGPDPILFESLYLNANHDPDDIMDAVAFLNGEPPLIPLNTLPVDSLSGTGDVRYDFDAGFVLNPGINFTFAFESFPNAPSGAYISGLTASPVPEPTVPGLLGLGLLGIRAFRFRRRHS